uniref:Carboxylesterase type B domain-containing protein n=1 Tax=Monodon monoceros TaxID=40151 RepID=A0A8C6AS03_MONMO
MEWCSTPSKHSVKACCSSFCHHHYYYLYWCYDEPGLPKIGPDQAVGIYFSSSHLSTDSGVSIFFYEFQHRPSSFAKIKPAWVRADHGAEKTFIFGGPFLMDESSMPEATGEEQELSLTMMAQWTHFSWTGQGSQWQGAASLAPIQLFRAIPGNQPGATGQPEAKEGPTAVLGRDTSHQDLAVAAEAEGQEGPGGARRQVLGLLGWGPT